MAACSSASSVAILASCSVNPVEETGSTLTKSTVPAMVDFRPSTGKRVTVRMPDSPAVSFAQLSSLPAPSDVTTPMPVTTTIGLPNLSRGADMVPPSMLRRTLRRPWSAIALQLPLSRHDPVGKPVPVPRTVPCLLDRLDQGHAFTLPMTGPQHHN